MHRSIRIATLALFIVASLCMTTPTTEANPTSWWQYTFFDASCNWLGYHLKNCSGTHTYLGSQTGTYMQYYEERCDGTGYVIAEEWYYNDNGTWVSISQPCP